MICSIIIITIEICALIMELVYGANLRKLKKQVKGTPYRKLLSKMTKKIKCVKLGSPCPENEIALAEKSVGYPFPQELKDLLGEVNGDGGWALMSAQEITETTNDLRNSWRAFFEEEGKQEEYVDNVQSFIFFAKNGCGDYYGYHIGADGLPEGTTIYIWEHEKIGEARCYRRVASNIEEFITNYYNDKL